MEDQFSLSDIRSALKRRKKPAFLTFFIVITVSVLYAALASPIYKSSSTILIEQQEIPQDLVRTTVTSYADQRIQMILQRVMTFAKLSELIKKYDLYADERKKEPLEVVVELMREDIGQKMISADVVDPRSGRPMEATIAFTLSYKSESAKTAQQIASEMTTLFLSENIKNRKEMASEAEDFLLEEVKRLETKSRELEANLAQFKENNLKFLPEMNTINMTIMDRTERELFEMNRQIQTLEERKIYLQSQLSQISPRSSVMTGDTDKVLSPQARAKLLQNRIIALSATYTNKHPDIEASRRELNEIIDNDHLPNDALFLRKQIELYYADLYGKHAIGAMGVEEKETLQKRIMRLEKKLSGVIGYEGVELSEVDNPAYINMATNLEATLSDLKHFKKSKQELKNKIIDLEKALTYAPEVEKKYRILTRDYDNTLLKYRELKEKQLQASLAKTLEDERKGERFTLIEPPLLPEKPIKPNRVIIGAAGLIFSFFFAGMMVFLLEKTDTTIFSPSILVSLTGAMPLVMVPHITTLEEQSKEKRRIPIFVTGALLSAVLMAFVIHIAVIPLDVLWYTAVRKLL